MAICLIWETSNSLELFWKELQRQIQIIEQAYDDFKHSYTEEVMIKKTFGVLEEN